MDQEELNSTISESMRLKMRNILRYKRFCGICTDYVNNTNLISEVIEIVADCWTKTTTLKDIVKAVFNDVENILLSTHICNDCLEKLIQSYIFIYNTRKSAKILVNYIDEMSIKSTDIGKHLNNVESDISNVVMGLNFQYSYNGITTHEKLTNNLNNNVKKIVIDKKMIRHGLKKYSNKTLEIEILCPKILKIDDCKTYSIMEGSIFSQLVKKNINFQGGLKVQEIEYNKLKEEKQCIMCLKEYSEKEFKSHDCKSNCPECSEMPCIHYKYLLSYKEQMETHSFQIKCLDCNYVCRKKEIFLEHINREHLDYHPYTCDQCGQQFYTKSILGRHIYKHHQDIYQCRFCDTELKKKTHRAEHKQICDRNRLPYACEKCPTSFDTTEELKNYKLKKHFNKFPCPLCDKTFLNVLKHKAHLVEAHKGIQIGTKTSIAECDDM